ncbi:MAG: hypothetical protein KAT43_05170 [Nanoarchaeota archaeon]|nr:hypothetical protein [Nanoarchaeota archaeon]
MTDSKAAENGRKFLVDYLRLHGEAMKEHLGYVVDFLHGNLPFMEMLNHAKGLPEFSGGLRRYPDHIAAIRRLTNPEILVIREYLIALEAYLSKAPFDPVDALADKIIDLTPIPESAKIPKDSKFYKGEPGTTLADMRIIV